MLLLVFICSLWSMEYFFNSQKRHSPLTGNVLVECNNHNLLRAFQRDLSLPATMTTVEAAMFTTIEATRETTRPFSVGPQLSKFFHQHKRCLKVSNINEIAIKRIFMNTILLLCIRLRYCTFGLRNASRCFGYIAD